MSKMKQGPAPEVIELMFKLRMLRRQSKLRQEDLAIKAGVSREALLRAESGYVNPRLDTVQNIARALGYTVTLTPISQVGEAQAQQDATAAPAAPAIQHHPL